MMLLEDQKREIMNVNSRKAEKGKMKKDIRKVW